MDLDHFDPRSAPLALADLPRPILLNVGRVAPEKNIAAFLDLAVAGSKVVIRGGPALDRLKIAYPDVLFLGPRHGAELASIYAAADVFASFPEPHRHLWAVNIEALACGIPVAAFPVPGPIDILGPNECGTHGGTARIGALDEDFGKAVARALAANRRAAVKEASYYRWDRSTSLFFDGLVPMRGSWADPVAGLFAAAQSQIAPYNSGL